MKQNIYQWLLYQMNQYAPVYIKNDFLDKNGILLMNFLKNEFALDDDLEITAKLGVEAASSRDDAKALIIKDSTDKYLSVIVDSNGVRIMPIVKDRNDYPNMTLKQVYGGVTINYKNSVEYDDLFLLKLSKVNSDDSFNTVILNVGKTEISINRKRYSAGDIQVQRDEYPNSFTTTLLPDELHVCNDPKTVTGFESGMKDLKPPVDADDEINIKISGGQLVDEPECHSCTLKTEVSKSGSLVAPNPFEDAPFIFDKSNWNVKNMFLEIVESYNDIKGILDTDKKKIKKKKNFVTCKRC